ncbi:MAG: tetratricopeptide repeat protein [Candidatus Binatia bacterium]
MKISGQWSMVNGQWSQGAAHCLRYAGLVALVFLILSLPSCSTAGPPALPSAVPLAAAPPADSGAADFSLPEGDTLEQQRAIFLQGYRFFEAKNYDEARRFFARALEVYPALVDYSLYHLGASNHEEKRNAEARTAFLRLLTEYPDSIWAGRAAQGLAALALAEGNWTEAVRYAEQARASRVSVSSVRHEAALVLAQAREAQGETAEAYRLYQELRAIAPRSAPGKTAKARVEDLRATAPDRFTLQDDQEYLAEIRLLSKEGDTARVEELIRQFSARFPASPLQSEVLSISAAAYKRQGQTEDAIAAWQEVVTRYPDSAVAPAALQDWATLLWNKDRDDEARSVFERLTQQYPRHNRAAEAWYALGRIFQESKEDERAAAAFQRLATLFPDNALAREGRWRQGWMAYRRGDFQQAENVFAALARSAPDAPEGESALYWQARSAEKLGLREKATQGYRTLLQRYPDGYYALWAEKRLQVTPPPLDPGAARAVSPPSLPPRFDRHHRRSQELQALGLLSLARRELDVGKEGAPLDATLTRFLLAEYSRLDGHAAALRLAVSLDRKDPGNWRRYLFPHAYWDLVSTQAQQKGLDPYLVLALIRQESLFDPDAVSPAQAYGLMQLLPATAARMTGSSPGVSSLTTPAFNIQAGTTYLRQLLDLYDNNLIMAVAGYNAGEKAVDKWRARYPGLAPDEFAESISYRETRNYVKLVLRNYRTYQRLYGKEEGNYELRMENGELQTRCILHFALSSASPFTLHSSLFTLHSSPLILLAICAAARRRLRWT